MGAFFLSVILPLSLLYMSPNYVNNLKDLVFKNSCATGTAKKYDIKYSLFPLANSKFE